jgi:Cd2+/Zn2+-exporting ATPase
MAVRSALCLLFAIAGWALHDRQPDVSTAAYMLAFLFGGWDLSLQVWRDLRELRFDTHFLMLLVVPGSVAVGAWGEGALLLILFSASSAMESYAAGRTRREIDALLRRAPKTARLIVDRGEIEVSVESLKPGDRVRVTANEQVPVDIEIDSGSSAADESSLTGESIPAPKSPGDIAYGGTINDWGVVEGRVKRPAADSALQRIIRLIESAQQLKAPVQRFTDRFGTGYTGLVLAGCAAVFAYSWLVQHAPPLISGPSQTSAFYRAMTLLVVLSPCALVLSVPSAILSAIAQGARHGILFRGGSAVENLAGIQIVALDKTGTLTAGDLQVSAFEPVAGDPGRLLAAASALARISNHPVSRAVARHLRSRVIDAPAPERSETLPGLGLRARWQDFNVVLGHRDLVAEVIGPNSPELPPLPEGSTETWIAGPGMAGRFLLSDTLRPESPGLIRQLHEAGVETCILTGDRESTASRIAEQTGVQSWRAGLRPEGKVAAIQEFRASGKRVAMVGDGVNDAPVLAAADVGIAMGARGSDAAIEQADIVLMQDKLENLLLARWISVDANRIIRQNLTLSLGTMGLMAVATLAFSGMPLSLGVAAHEGSTVLVVLNSLRLLIGREQSRIKPRAGATPRSPSASTPPSPPATRSELPAQS